MARIFYEHRGLVDDEDGALELMLDGEPILFDADSDGESLRVREQPWVDPFKEPLSDENRVYLEEYGRWCRVDCSRKKPYTELCGQVVGEACELLNEFRKVAGMRISVSTRSMWFAVHGDESHVYWAQPIGFTEVA